MDELYPDGPQGVPADLVRPTSTYKHRAWLAMASLVLFVVLYVALGVWFVWTAYRMLGSAVLGGPDAMVHWLVGGCAAFLAVFMLKALLFIERGGVPDAVEVTAKEQPRLFAFLAHLADEAGAPRPSRVYLSPRVNAAVFYDLTVFNLVFPSRKNLEIGLALVNVLTLSEFKAVLAHEFGHFAQRTMAIGSWVYVAQRIASQLIGKRDVLDKLLATLSGIDVRIAWIGWLLSLVVWSIRSLMDTLLRLVVLAQRALSRQMEFQADLVAVSLTGSDELVHALHKLQAADEAWSRSLAFASGELQQGRIPHDLFAVHTRIIANMARILGDTDYGRTPAAAAACSPSFRLFKAGFAQPPQMWATHPANTDREDNAKRRYLPAPHDARSAWLLFDDVDAVKGKVTTPLLANAKGELASAEQTLTALDERYDLLRYASRYRGAYLGRALTRHANDANELYETVLHNPDIEQALAQLYPQQLTEDLARLRELEDERRSLQALHERVFQPTGGRIVYRGREISRRDLPAAISIVNSEEEQARQAILAHDRRCRSAHLAAAAKLGGGWHAYLLGLIDILHYAEHSLADLADAHGLLRNVYAVVTADGKVSSRERRRLVAAANVLHGVLAGVFGSKEAVRLDAQLLARLGVEAWSETLETFKLEPASDANLGNWLNVIDGWVNSASNALSTLCGATLEQLLVTENLVAQSLREQSAPGSAPQPSIGPGNYPALLPGHERKRQQRLGLWDRFQTADGLFGTIARLLVAGAIVGAVLGLGSIVGTTAKVTIYNGLGTTVKVAIGSQDRTLPPYSTAQVDIDVSKAVSVASRAARGDVIESFAPTLSSRVEHYVYNIAGASPLVQWTAIYGPAQERPPVMLGAPRWLTSSADVLFAEPPSSVKTSAGGGAIRTVLDSPGDRAPDEMLTLLRDQAERAQVIAAHAKWDGEDRRNTSRWRGLASQ